MNGQVNEASANDKINRLKNTWIHREVKRQTKEHEMVFDTHTNADKNTNQDLIRTCM